MSPPNLQRKSGLAIASLVLGITGLLTFVIGVGLLLAVPAVILGHIALRQIKKSSVAVTGDDLAIGGLVLGYLTPVIFLSLLEPAIMGQKAAALGNGKQIYMAQLGMMLETGKANCWPKSADFSTSTAVITNLVSSGVLRVDYSFFSEPGLPASKTTNAALFHAENNAWCFVADLDLNAKRPHQIPVLFTRNLRVSNLGELQGRAGEQMSVAQPFGRKGVAMVFMDGHAAWLQPDMLWSNVLGGRTFTNRVLRP